MCLKAQHPYRQNLISQVSKGYDFLNTPTYIYKYVIFQEKLKVLWCTNFYVYIILWKTGYPKHHFAFFLLWYIILYSTKSMQQVEENVPNPIKYIYSGSASPAESI